MNVNGIAVSWLLLLSVIIQLWWRRPLRHKPEKTARFSDLKILMKVAFSIPQNMASPDFHYFELKNL